MRAGRGECRLARIVDFRRLINMYAGHCQHLTMSARFSLGSLSVCQSVNANYVLTCPVIDAGGRELVDAGVVAGVDMTPEVGRLPQRLRSALTSLSSQCALTKLSYLLSKPNFSVERVRALMGSPIRGELSIPNLAETAPVVQDSPALSVLLSQLISLIAGTTSMQPIPSNDNDDVSHIDETAAWSSTQRDSMMMEAALAPYLLSLAAAKNDSAAMKQLLASMHALDSAKVQGVPGMAQHQQVSGAVNKMDPASGRNALHTAAMNGSLDCLQALLEAGALVHMRDTLGHTA